MIPVLVLISVAAAMLVAAWRTRGLPKSAPAGWDCFLAEFDSTTAIPDGEGESTRYRFWITEPDGSRRLVGGVLSSSPDLHLGQTVRLAVSPGRDGLRLIDRSGLSAQQIVLLVGAGVCVLFAVIRVVR